MYEFDEDIGKVVVRPGLYSKCRVCGEVFEPEFPDMAATAACIMPNICDECSDYLTKKKKSDFKIVYWN